ncbi:hypothetical protein BOX15_Mlig011887g1 [Macrostomum lignano]|uniref:AAA+ ATPase domain-containing protein n=1 Tax=Macrostomum lignano TaxID=282301 RepID=A0A267FH06_9PLAT|nr:hypothetical protein BOX15_Mlig011887g1 [Macrostomum lignano]
MFCRYKKRIEESNGDESETSSKRKLQFKGKLFKNELVLYKNIMHGNLYAHCPNLSNVIRIFTSSTFTDTKHERNRLMVDVYPKLKAFCRQLGLEFQVVDMRWGVRFETVDDHKTTELCLAEIDNCNQLSRGPTFVTFLSHKYGYRPFPREIAADEFDKIVAKLDKTAKALFNKWFKLDSNSVPLSYVLQSISSVIEGYNEDATPAERRKFGKLFWQECEIMQESLLKAVKKVLPPSQMEKYFMSVTETEIQEGIIKAKNPKVQCIWFYRDIVDIDNQPETDLLKRFRESANDPSAVSSGIQDRLARLKREKIPSVLPAENISRFTVHWSHNGIDPDNVPEHQAYLDSLCADFETRMKMHILESVIGAATAGGEGRIAGNSLAREVIQHARFAQSKSATFYGRQPLLNLLTQYLAKPASSPLICYGVSGCGKTSLMAKLAFAMLDRHRPLAADGTDDGSSGPGAFVLLRFLGTTQNSSSLRELLNSLINQSRRMLGVNKDGVNIQSVKTLATAVVLMLKRLASIKPVLVVLDSIDQLKPDDSAHSCFWLPQSLPENVWFVVSTLPEEHGILDSLKTIYKFDTDEGRQNFVEVTQLDPSDSKAILREQLRQRDRILTDKQLRLLETCVARVALPLYARLCVDFAAKWSSFSVVDEEALAPTVREIISQLFAGIERKHGVLLVRRALGYLTVSYAGLSENELEDILALDDDVLNDTFEYWMPPVRRLPPLAINRVIFDLQDYLVEQGSEGVPTLRWYHRQFLEAAVDRFCSDADTVEQMHQLMAEFFTGVWAAKPKPFVDLSAKGSGQEGSALRYVPDQPTRFEGGEFNRRKLVELPHHLLLAGDIDSLKSHCLANFEFLHSLAKAKGVDACIEAFRAALQVWPDDQLLNSLGSLFNQSHQTLAFEPDLLPLQLLTRLPPASDEDNQLIRAKLLADAASATNCKIFAPIQIVRRGADSIGDAQAGGLQQGLMFSLAKHKKSVVALAVSEDFSKAVTVGEESAVSFWDLDKGSCLRTVQLGEDLDPAVYFVNHDRQAVVTVSSGFAVLQFGSGVYVRSFKRADGQFSASPVKDAGRRTIDNRIFVHPIRGGSQLVVFGNPYLHILSCDDWTEVGRIDLAHSAAAAKIDKVFTGLNSYNTSTPVAGIDKYLLVVEPEMQMSIYQFDLQKLQFLQHKIYFRERSDEEMDAGESDESIDGLYIDRNESQCLFLETDKKEVHFCQLPSLDIIKVVSLTSSSVGLIRSGDLIQDNLGRHWVNDRYLILPSERAHQPCVLLWDSRNYSCSQCCPHPSRVSINAIRVDSALQKVVTVCTDACLYMFDRTKEAAAATESGRAKEAAQENASYSWKNSFVLDSDERYIVYSGLRTIKEPGKDKRTDSLLVVYDTVKEEKVREFCMPTKRSWTVSKYNDSTVLIEHNRKGYLLDLIGATVTMETQGVSGGTIDMIGVSASQQIVSISRSQRSLKLHDAVTGKASIALPDVFGSQPTQVISEMIVTPGGRYVIMCDENKNNKFVCYQLRRDENDSGNTTDKVFDLKDGTRTDLSLYDAFATNDEELLVTLAEAKVGPKTGRLRSISCLTVWNLRTRVKQRVLFDQEFADKAMGKLDDMDTLYFASLGGRFVVTGHDDGYVRVWHLEQSTPLTRQKAHDHMISDMFAPRCSLATDGVQSSGQTKNYAMYFVSVCDDDAEMSFKYWKLDVTETVADDGKGRWSVECTHMATYKMMDSFKQFLALQNGTRVLLLLNEYDTPQQLVLMDPNARAEIWGRPDGPEWFGPKKNQVTLSLFDGEKFPTDPSDPDKETDRPESDYDDD